MEWPGREEENCPFGIFSSLNISSLLHSKISSPWTSFSLYHSRKLGEEWDSRIAPLLLEGGSRKGKEKKKNFSSIGKYIQNVIFIVAFKTDSRKMSDPDSLVDPSWDKAAHQFWRTSHWPEILFLTGLDRKRTITTSENLLLQSFLSSFINSFKASAKMIKNQPMIEQIVFDLIAHLSTHKLDPFNLFLGACPSESFSRSFRSIGSPSNSSPSPPSSPIESFSLTPPLQMSIRRSPSISLSDSDNSLASSSPSSPNFQSSTSAPLLLPPAMVTDNTSTEEKENEASNVILGGGQIESYIDLVMRWSNFLNFPDQILKEISVVAENVQKSQCWGTGCLVAVEVDALSPCQRKWFTNPNWKKVWDCRFIFCRIASHHLFKDHGGSVDIFVDPFERGSIRVVASSVFTFDQKELDKELTVFNRKWFSRPSDFFFNRCVEIIEKTVNKFLCTDPNASKAKDLFHIEEAFKEHERRESLSGSSEFKSQIFEHLFQKTNEFLEEWVADVPHGLVCPPRLSFYAHMIDELLKSFPKMVSQEIESHLTLAKTRLQSFTKRLQMVINGTSKNFVCSWWLNHIQDETDRFLKKRGFDLEALPPDYTDTPPKDISIVERNQQILMELLKVDEDNGDCGDDGDDEKRDGESKHSDESLDHFVDETVQRVYERLDELMSEMEFVLQRGWESFILDEFRCQYSESDFDSLRKDYEYLKKVKAMDQQIKMEEKKGKEKKRVEMSEVVPVAGLVMARFHIYDCEISTALDLWGQKKKPILQKAESQVAFPAEYLSISSRSERISRKNSTLIEPSLSSEDKYSQMRQEICSLLQLAAASDCHPSQEEEFYSSGARSLLEDLKSRMENRFEDVDMPRSPELVPFSVRSRSASPTKILVGTKRRTSLTKKRAETPPRIRHATPQLGSPPESPPILVDCSRCGEGTRKDLTCTRCCVSFCMRCGGLSQLKNPCFDGNKHLFDNFSSPKTRPVSQSFPTSRSPSPTSPIPRLSGNFSHHSQISPRIGNNLSRSKGKVELQKQMSLGDNPTDSHFQEGSLRPTWTSSKIPQKKREGEKLI